MLDVVVLIAMAVTAAAFAVGLIIHSGIAQIPALIAAAALYMVMAASYLMVARGARSTPVTDRLNELEEALEIIDGDLQRIDRVEDDVARLDLLNDRVERLDQAVSDYGSTECWGPCPLRPVRRSSRRCIRGSKACAPILRARRGISATRSRATCAPSRA